MQIALFSGELSGDRIGGALARELLAREPGLELWGVGSKAMQDAGVELIADSASWGAISITEALPKVPRFLLKVAPLVRATLRKRKPDLVVAIDFGAFNVRLARFCKSIDLKVCYYFPPGSWRRTGYATPELAKTTDLILTPFKWSVDRYEQIGANVEWVGHPILENTSTKLSREEFIDNLGLNPNDPIIGLLPGSRSHEIQHLMPAMLDAAGLIAASEKRAQFVIGVAPGISQDQMYKLLTGRQDLKDRLTEIWHDLSEKADRSIISPLARGADVLKARTSPILVTDTGVLVPERKDPSQQKSSATSLPAIVLARNMTHEVQAYSDLLLVCSGTATLEAAIFGTPMIILYRGSRIMAMEYKLRGLKRKIQYIGLPNIMMDKKIVPELIQEEASPSAISEASLRLMRDLELRSQMRTDLFSVRDALGTSGASGRAAEKILQLLHTSKED